MTTNEEPKNEGVRPYAKSELLDAAAKEFDRLKKIVEAFADSLKFKEAELPPVGSEARQAAEMLSTFAEQIWTDESAYLLLRHWKMKQYAALQQHKDNCPDCQQALAQRQVKAIQTTTKFWKN